MSQTHNHHRTRIDSGTLIALFVATSGMVCGAARAQRDFSKVEIKTTHVAGNIYMLEGSGGNIGVSAGVAGVIIIDDQFAPLADKIKDALKKINKGKLAFVLNTHYHGDHVGGNVEFGRDATIIAHANVRRRLSTTQELFGRTTPPLPKEGLPVITFDNHLTIHFNGEEIRAIHFPHGHTDGDSVIFFSKSNVIHMADLYFNGMFPFVDLDHGGDVQGLADNVQAVIELADPDAKIIAGHGPLGTVSDLKNYHRMLTDSIDLVTKAIADGKSLADIQSGGMPAKWKAWEGGFIPTDKWLDTVHRSLSR